MQQDIILPSSGRSNTPWMLSGRNHATNPVGPSTIGQPIKFISGPFAGRVMRAQLQEIQKADIGRKFGMKDRRPLDPPPVVQLRMYEIRTEGTSRRQEQEVSTYDESLSIGLICHADLFLLSPAPFTTVREASDPLSPESRAYYDRSQPMTAPSKAASPSVSYGGSLAMQAARGRNLSSFLPPLAAQAAPAPRLPSVHLLLPPLALPPSPTGRVLPHLQSHLARGSPLGPARTQQAASRVAPHPAHESFMCTESLVGTRTVAACCVDHLGENALMFVFGDLAIKAEGTYMLRYRIFDAWASAYGGEEHPALAECFGGCFRVYSTKEFPGLPISTNLTKRLARQGIRVNLREQRPEREQCRKSKRRRTSHPAAENVEGSPQSSSDCTGSQIQMLSPALPPRERIADASVFAAPQLSSPHVDSRTQTPPPPLTSPHLRSWRSITGVGMRGGGWISSD